MTTVGLVQINQGFSGQSYFPYSVGILEAHARRHLSDPGNYEFLLPIFRRMPVEAAANSLVGADVVGMSLYVWNAELSYRIAEALKAKSPDTLIVFGGPHVPDQVEHLHKHEHKKGEPDLLTLGRKADRVEEFLKAHPYIDVVVHGEGEQAFTAILEDPAKWRDAPSVSYLAEGRVRHNPRAARLKDLSQVPSPYLEGIFDRLIAENPGHQWIAMWETNRGCPFSCTFCDWGSAVASKVTGWEEERLYREVDWFAEHKITYVFCADANFGIWKRDIELARYCAEVKARTGYPAKLSVQSAKNAEERVFQTQQILEASGLNQGVVVSMQSMDAQTLKDIKRGNIRIKDFVNLQRRFTQAGIETMSDLILGLPGETYESFADGVSYLIELGQHNRIQFNDCAILPNAEMGDPAYRERYGMQTVRSKVVNIHGVRESEEVPEYQELVIATNSLPREDWVRTRAYAWMTAFLHFDKLLRLPIVLVHETTGAKYREIIELFSEDFLPKDRFPVIAGVREFFRAKAREIQAGGEEYCHSPEWLDMWWPADEMMFIKLATTGTLDAFYLEARHALALFMGERGQARYLEALNAAVLLNKELLKRPFVKGDQDVELPWNVWEFVQGAVRDERVPLEEGAFAYRIDRTSEHWDSWEDWCKKVVWWGNKRGAYLYGNRPTEQLAGHF
jgi:radical SAM superfamily enzyme YgiQ (UPF0313 family)